MKAYKLVRLMKDGTISSLFIGKRNRLPIGKWMRAECIPTKGYTVREGWHCTRHPEAPHLSMKGRVWVEVYMDYYKMIQRPPSQGGRWYIAQWIKITRIVKC